MKAQVDQKVAQESGENTPNLVEALPIFMMNALPGLQPEDAALITAVAWKMALWRNIQATAEAEDLALTAAQRGDAPRRLMRMWHHLNKADTAAGRVVPGWIPVFD